MKKLIFVISLFIIMFSLNSGVARAVVLTFEDLYPSIPETERHLFPLGNYGGFSWHNTGAIRDDYSPGSGYDLGTIGRVSIFTAYSNPISLSSSTPFNFNGAYVTSAWFEENEFTIEGWLDGELKYSQTFATSNDAAYWFDFNFVNVDNVVFKPKYAFTSENRYFAYNGHLAIDGISFNIIPEPASLMLLTIGLLGAGVFRRKYKS